MARFVRKNGIDSYLKKLKASYLYCMYMFYERRKEGRKKQARSNKQQGKATQRTQGSHFSKEK